MELTHTTLPLDFDSARERLALIAQSRFPEWTDHTTPSFGNTLLDMQAFIADVLSFYTTAQGREARLATATQRENVVAIARMLGYKPRRATAASTQEVFQLRQPHPKPVVIPAGFRVSTARAQNPQVYELEAAVVIAPGDVSGAGTVEASARRFEVVDMAGTPGQTATLTHAPYLDGSVDVRDAYGQPYVEVDTFVDSKAIDRHFVLIVGSHGRATLQFGDGILGAVPTGRIDVRYKTGGGAAGTVEADALTVLERPVLDTDGRPVEVTCTNPEASIGGADEEGIESIRINAPRRLRATSRTVTREDFEINAKRVEGVTRALMLTSNEEPSIPENTGRLHIVPKAGGPLSHELKDAITKLFSERYPYTLTFQLCVESATYAPVDVAVEAELAPIQSGEPWTATATRREAVRNAILRALHQFFAVTLPNGAPNNAIDFGYNLRGPDGTSGAVAWSDLVGVVGRIPDVRKVNKLTLNGCGDMELTNAQFPVLGNTSIQFADDPEEAI